MKAVIFDLDGVLVGTPKYRWVSDNKALNHFDVSISEIEHKIYEGTSLKIRVPLYEKKFGVEIDFEKFSEIFIKTQLDLIKEEIEETKDEIQEIISILKRKGLKIAVATSARKEKVIPILRWLGVHKVLDFILTSDDLDNHKPHPDPYLKTLKVLGVKPSETIIVEDSPHGITSGKAAIIKVVALKTDSFSEKDIREADIIISNLRELIKIVENS